MTPWQRRARSVIAIVAVAFAIVVVFALKRRMVQPPVQPAARTDPGAIVEVTGGRVERFKLSREDVRVAYERQLTYANGSTKLMDVTIAADERGGSRSFTVTGKEADVGQNESTIHMDGDVRLAASDGMTVRTEHASYFDTDGFVRAMGPVEFSRGRMAGSGFGMTYDTVRDVLVILDRAIVHVAPDESGAGAAEIRSGSAAFGRREKNVRFERDVKLQRDGQLIEADAAVAYLTPDEKQIQLMELRGRSRITNEKPAAGGLQELTARDMDLKYGADGQALEHAVLTGDGAILLAGSAGAAGRQIKAGTIDVSLAPDGSTPVALTARESVVLTLPAERAVPARTIRSAAMDGKGEPGRGLTQAQFTGDVEFRERGPGGPGSPGGPEGNDIDRIARAATLDVALKPAMAGILDARFSHGVRFFEGTGEGPADDRCASGRSSRFQMCAAAIRYDLDKGVLALTGSEPGSVRPRVVNDRIAIDAAQIDVTLAGPDVKAAGAVKSVVAAGRDGGSKSDTRLPSMLKQDKPVNVTADALDYSGTANKAAYTGNAQLWQDDTSLKGPSIILDDKTGDLTASGNVTTVTVRNSVNKDRKTERVRSIATAADFRYEESAHRATYTGNAHMNSPDGDMTAAKIELYLKPAAPAGPGGSGENDLERAEAYDNVTLRDQNRTTTGTRLTYTTADQRYVITGAPVKVLDECRRETIGRTLTYLKSAETITIDGNEQTRTQTKGSAQCP